MDTTTNPSPARPRTEITCSRCNATATVPFVPTPGRPVYCRACFDKRPAPSPRRGGFGRAPPNVQPRRRMLSYGRKDHFVYDALETLDENPAMDEDQRRTFVEMLFTRGARQGTDAAQLFLTEKRAEDVLRHEEADALERIVRSYTEKR